MRKTAVLVLVGVMLALWGCGEKKVIGHELTIGPGDVVRVDSRKSHTGTIVIVRLSPQKREEFAALTKENLGKEIDVIVGAEVVARPLVKEYIESPVMQISCDTPEKAQRIMDALGN